VKILSIGNFGTGWDGSICDEEHIASALEQLGHEVHRWQREDAYFKLFSNRDPFASLESDFKPPFDFVLVAQWDGYDANSTMGDFVADLKEFGKKPIVYWAFDYQADGQEWHERLVKGADLYLSKRIADSKYTNWQWLSQDFAPQFLEPAYDHKNWMGTDSIKKDIDVLFTGTYLPWATERNETLKAVDENFNLVIHSINPDEWRAQGFKNIDGPVMDYELPSLIARAKINLSIDHTIEAGYWSDRNAQIMSCRGFVLFKYVPLSESTFHNNVAYFSNKQQCLKGIAYYLENEEDRELIAHEGYLYAKNYMTVHDRVVDLLTIVGNIL
jgi:hypothetical protein